MRIINFAKRNIKELVRDPASIIFSVCLPLVVLIIFQQFNIPAEQYSIENFTPSIIVFSFSFISLFVSSLIAKDRSTSLLTRLFSSPMKAKEYILGYSLALIPLTIIQSILFFIVGICFGLEVSINIIFVILALIPMALLFIGLGILIGCITTDKAAGPCGSLVIQFVAFTSGMWFPVDQVGKIFEIVCKILPFSSVVDITRALLNGTSINWLPKIGIISLYIIIIFIITIYMFKKKMFSDNK